MRKSAFVAVSATFALILFAKGAAASTVFLDPVSNNTVSPVIYDTVVYEALIHKASNTSPFTDTYFFNFVAPLPNIVLTTGDKNSVVGTFTFLTLDWNFMGGASLIGGPQDINSNTPQQFTVPLTGGAGVYELIISGKTISDTGATYLASLQASTPLPGAALLFGSVFAGGFGFSKLRRRFAARKKVRCQFAV